MIEIIFFFILCFVFFFLLYPAFVYLRFLLFKKNILRSDSFLEPVSIIIACYNEEKFIGEKILSYLHENEWIEGSEIIVVSSGCIDNSNNILDNFNLPGKLLVIKPLQRMSKIDSVNLAVSYAKHDLLVFSDCRQKMKPLSVKSLIHNFNDPSVGTVVASLEDQNGGKKGSFSRILLNFINYYDGQTGSCLNVYGALYAQRKILFRNFPNNIIFDDLFVVSSTLSQGKWLIQEKDAVIYDVPFDSYYGNERIERLARGLLLFLFRQNKVIGQMNFSTKMRFLFYKYAKLVLPFCLLPVMVYLIYLLILSHDTLLYSSLLIILSAILVIKGTRTFLMLILRINYHFLLATLKFAFFKKRSVLWEKINSDNKNIY